MLAPFLLEFFALPAIFFRPRDPADPLALLFTDTCLALPNRLATAVERLVRQQLARIVAIRI